MANLFNSRKSLVLSNEHSNKIKHFENLGLDRNNRQFKKPNLQSTPTNGSIELFNQNKDKINMSNYIVSTIFNDISFLKKEFGCFKLYGDGSLR